MVIEFMQDQMFCFQLTIITKICSVMKFVGDRVVHNLAYRGHCVKSFYIS
jgi:hypothetical protein